MVKKIITWVDLQGRYHVLSPAYGDPTNAIFYPVVATFPAWELVDVVEVGDDGEVTTLQVRKAVDHDIIIALSDAAGVVETTRIGEGMDFPFFLQRVGDQYILKRLETEDEIIERVWAKHVAVGAHQGVPYGITIDHPRHMVEDADQRAKLVDCCGTYFRWGVFMLPNREGVIDPQTKKIKTTRDGRDGAWEMDDDGTPKVNIPKAREIQMDFVRLVRNVELAGTDVPFRMAWERWMKEETPTSKRALEAIIESTQLLRDIPESFVAELEVCTTPQEIQDAWPSELPPRI